MIKFCPLFSGSSGNSIFIKYKDTSILVDAGLSKKKIVEELAKIQEKPEDLDAILVTHEHSDHTSGLGVMERGYNIPIFANRNTWFRIPSSIGKIREENIRTFNTNERFYIKDMEIIPFRTLHDAVDPVGFSFYLDTKKISTLTDTGELSPDILDNIKGSDLLLLESNHDMEMLLNGSYPWPLKNRIRGKYGHLCNSTCANAVVDMIEEGLRVLVLGHLSQDNNLPSLAYSTIKERIEQCGYSVGKDILVKVAKREGNNRPIIL